MSRFTDRMKKSMIKRRVSLRHLAVDIVLMFASLYLSLYLRVSLRGLPEYIDSFSKLVLIFLVVKVACLIHFKVYTAIWRYFSVIDVNNILKGVLTSSVTCIVLSYLISDWAKLPRSILLIDFVMTIAFMVGVRFLRRLVFEKFNDQNIATNQTKFKTLIYSSDSQVKNLLQNANFRAAFETVGILMDDRGTWNRTYNAVPVLGDLSILSTLLRNNFANHIVIAQQNISADLIKEIFEICRPFNVRPSISNINTSHLESTEIYYDESVA